TRSAPYWIGVCPIGVAKQLSTLRMRLCLRESAAAASRSMISRPGLVGVSRKNIFVLGRMAFSQEAGSAASTYEYSMPYLGRYLVTTVWVLPKMDLEDRRWSPFLSRAIKEAKMALIPEAVAKPASAP